MDFESLYNLSFEKIYKFFYYKYVDKETVEDLVHDVFIRYFQKYKDSNHNSNESIKLLYGISRNVYKEWVRKSIKENKIQFLDNIDYVDESVITEEELINEDLNQKIFQANVDKIRECIGKLNINVRNVLEQRFLHGKTRKETAEILNLSEDTVHTYQKRGIKYLKNMLGTTVPPKS